MSAPESHRYRICVEGHLDPTWSDRIAGMKVGAGDPGPPVTTILTGELVDQSAFHGVLNTLLGLGLQVVSTERLPTE